MRALYAERARALVGTLFRAQGRDPAVGLDCAGLAIHAYGLHAEDFRRNYRLRGQHRDELNAVLTPYFRRVSRPRCIAGDLMMLGVCADQVHLGVRTDAGFVHADAKIGRVVETPGRPAWPVLAVFRRRSRQAGR